MSEISLDSVTILRHFLVGATILCSSCYQLSNSPPAIRLGHIASRCHGQAIVRVCRCVKAVFGKVCQTLQHTTVSAVNRAMKLA